MLEKFGSFSRSHIAFQFEGSIQSLGFIACDLRSTLISLLPFKKKLYYSRSIYFNLTVIINPSNSLSFSKSPRQAYL